MHYDYTGQTIDDKVVLELGPEQISTRFYQIKERQYITIDANRLIDQTPPFFITNS